MPSGTQDGGKMTVSSDGKRSADTDISINDVLRESFLFQAPDQLMADAKLAERLIKQGPMAQRQRSMIESLGEERKMFGGLAERFERDANNIAPEQRKLRAAASSASAQSLRDRGAGTSAAGTLREQLRTAKARQGIIQRGDEAIRGQRLKDRLSFVRNNLQRRSGALNLAGQGQQIAAGVKLNAQNVGDSVNAARAGAVGGALGSFAGIMKGNKDDNGSFFDFGKKNSSGLVDGSRDGGILSSSHGPI